MVRVKFISYKQIYGQKYGQSNPVYPRKKSILLYYGQRLHV